MIQYVFARNGEHHNQRNHRIYFYEYEDSLLKPGASVSVTVKASLDPVEQSVSGLFGSPTVPVTGKVWVRVVISAAEIYSIFRGGGGQPEDYEVRNIPWDEKPLMPSSPWVELTLP